MARESSKPTFLTCNRHRRFVELEPAQADLLARVLADTQVTLADLSQAGVLPVTDGFHEAVMGSQ